MSGPAVSAPPRAVAIAGATGYAGRELVRLLAAHPAVRIHAALGSSADAPPPLAALAHVFDEPFRPFDLAALRAAEFAFLALPDDATARVAPDLLRHGVRVIDISGTFRLRDEGARAHWYPAAPPLDARVAYGLSERRRAEIRQAQLVACPGCYPTAALLALEPILELIAGDIFIDAKSGVSGAGKTPTERTHFCECHGNVSAYSLFSHRHTPEIEQEIRRAVTFVPHLVPLDRGLLATIYATLRPGVTDDRLAAAYQVAYADAPFVRVTGARLPEIRHVAWTNFCDIGWRADATSNRVVIVSALDNLLKGAAGQAVQNLNLMLGLDERTGLLSCV